MILQKVFRTNDCTRFSFAIKNEKARRAKIKKMKNNLNHTRVNTVAWCRVRMVTLAISVSFCCFTCI